MHRARFTILGVLCAANLLITAAEWRALDARTSHLRSGTTAEWSGFADSIPLGPHLDLSFDSRRNTNEQTLLLWQDDVKLDWNVELNGKRLGKLVPMEAPLEATFRLPIGALRDGSNRLSVIPPRENDDIQVGNFRLNAQSPEAALRESLLQATILDENGLSIPARLTITDTNGTLVALHVSSNVTLAARPGIVYTADGRAAVKLRAGAYRIAATRGFEFSLATTNITLTNGEQRAVELRLRREVSTPRLVSCDTHVHTFTYSRHGDATIEERAVTLAGEGIELPILTDHDLAIDLNPAAQTTGTRQFFTPVIGDEVTTRAGHFNIFPVKPGAALPSNRETNWTRLLDSFRATPGVEVVVLNHPRNTHNAFQPFARTNFDHVTGEARWPFDFRFDVMELLNSSAQQSDYTTVLHDWFALLNAGYHIAAVGSSDGHDVSRYIVGQGRTYIEVDDGDVSAVNVGAACRSLKEGRAYVSMGLLPILTVNDQFRPGDLATNAGAQMRITIQVRAPSWISCTNVTVFANGVSILETNISTRSTQSGIAAEVTWSLPKPNHDIFLVAVATGPGNTAPHWGIPKPYQSASPHWTPRVIGLTNPVRVDSDADGIFSSARDYARRLVTENSGVPARVSPALAGFDEAVAIQCLALLRERGIRLESAEVQQAFDAQAVCQRALRRVLAEER